MVNTIDAKLLAKMFLAGAKNLEAKKEWINELNVFPVPDGDTGTNMTLTIMSAAKEVAVMEDPDMATLCRQSHPVPFVEREEIQVLSFHSCSEVLPNGSRGKKHLRFRSFQKLLIRRWKLLTKQL